MLLVVVNNFGARAARMQCGSASGAFASVTMFTVYSPRVRVAGNQYSNQTQVPLRTNSSPKNKSVKKPPGSPPHIAPTRLRALEGRSARGAGATGPRSAQIGRFVLGDFGVEGPKKKNPRNSNHGLTSPAFAGDNDFQRQSARIERPRIFATTAGRRGLGDFLDGLAAGGARPRPPSHGVWGVARVWRWLVRRGGATAACRPTRRADLRPRLPTY